MSSVKTEKYNHDEKVQKAVERMANYFINVLVELEENQKQVMLALFVEKASDIVKIPRINHDGKMTEIIEASQIKAKVNNCKQGVDITTDSGDNIEIKCSKEPNNPNFMFKPPKKTSKETVDQYRTRAHQYMISKGTVHCVHRFNDIEKTEYVFDASFISAIVLSKSNSEAKSVNLGGACCKACKKVPRLLYYHELQKEYLQNPRKFDTAKFHVQVSANDCECKKKAV